MSELEPTRTYSNPTATDVLRRLLDERGVEHYDGTERTLWGYEQTGEDTGIYRFSASEISGGFLQFDMFRITPEQAIAATLGSCNCSNNCTNSERTGTCYNVNHGLTFVCSECGANVDTASSIGYSYVDEFGKRWYGASNDYGLNYCPNCGAKVVAE